MDQSQLQAGKKPAWARRTEKGAKAQKEVQKTEDKAAEEPSGAGGNADASKDKAEDAAKEDAPAPGFLASLRGRAPGKEGAEGDPAASSGGKKRGGKRSSPSAKLPGVKIKGGGDVPTVLLAVGSAYLTGRLVNTVMRTLRGGGAPAPGSAGMERELARVQQKLRVLRESEQELQREKASWLQAKSRLQEARHADTLRQMEATLETALSRNNAEWGQKLKAVQDEANGKLAQVQAWQEELEKLRSEASQIRTLIEQVRSRSNSPSGRGRGQSPLSAGKENSLLSST